MVVWRAVVVGWFDGVNGSWFDWFEDEVNGSWSNGQNRTGVFFSRKCTFTSYASQIAVHLKKIRGPTLLI